MRYFYYSNVVKRKQNTNKAPGRQGLPLTAKSFSLHHYLYLSGSAYEFVAGFFDNLAEIFLRDFAAGFDVCLAALKIDRDSRYAVHLGECIVDVFLSVGTHHTFDCKRFFHGIFLFLFARMIVCRSR